jgi:hypothetical protein
VRAQPVPSHLVGREQRAGVTNLRARAALPRAVVASGRHCAAYFRDRAWSISRRSRSARGHALGAGRPWIDIPPSTEMH